jgi:hypothetical protein
MLQISKWLSFWDISPFLRKQKWKNESKILRTINEKNGIQNHRESIVRATKFKIIFEDHLYQNMTAKHREN